MKILSFDTSSPLISVAVLENDRVLSRVEEHGNASILLLPCLEKALQEAGATLGQIDAFAIGEGPGSYNGLRCGFATLTGLLLPRPRPVFKINSLAAMVSNVECRMSNVEYPVVRPRSPHVSCVEFKNIRGAILNARKKKLFFEKFLMENGVPKLLDEGMVDRLDEIPGRSSGEVSWFSYEVEGFPVAHPNAVAIAHLAAISAETSISKQTVLEPRYLRPPV